MPDATLLAAAGEPARARLAGGARAVARPALCGRAWDAYLVLAVALVGVVVPGGPGQTALLDLPNAVALVALLAVVLSRGTRIEFPFAVPWLAIFAGSCIAMTNANDVPGGLLALAQDVYLYLWFVALVALLARRGSLVPLRVVWLCAANVVVVIGIVHLVLVGKRFPQELWQPEGERMAATFYNPNMCADYLVLSLFLTVGLIGQARRWFLVGTGLLLVAGIMLTKSNGGLISLLLGSTVALVSWLWTGGPRLRRGALVALLVAGALGLLGWRALEDGMVQGAAIERLQRASFLGRMGESGTGREEIWKDLARTYELAPLGIGPGNSTAHTVAIGERERPNSLQSKEAHSDYLGYAVERGPVALVALLVWIVLTFVMVVRGRHAIAAKVGGVRAGRILTASLLGGLVASAVHSTVVEKLHFRHFWVFLALACALTAASRRPLAPQRRSAAS
jgi:O-antigen ligase